MVDGSEHVFQVINVVLILFLMVQECVAEGRGEFVRDVLLFLVVIAGDNEIVVFLLFLRFVYLFINPTYFRSPPRESLL